VMDDVQVLRPNGGGTEVRMLKRLRPRAAPTGGSGG
jgi:hypothetical protein